MHELRRQFIFNVAMGNAIWNEGSLTHPAPSTLPASLAATSTTPMDASLIGAAQRVVDSVASLRSIQKADTSRVFLIGYYAAGDGGGGLYYHDSTDNISADNGGTIIVASDGGRWKLIATGTVSVKQFGATGATGSDTVDDYRPIAAAIAYIASHGGGAVYVPRGRYRVGNTISLPEGVRLVGEGYTTRWRSSETPTLIDFRGSGSAVTVVAPASGIVDSAQIYGIQFDGTHAAAGCHGLFLDATAASSSIEGFLCENSAFTNFPGNQIRIDGNVFDATCKRVTAMNPNRAASHCVFMQHTLPSQITFDDCWIAPYTASTWGIYASICVDLRLIGGTIAPYDNSVKGANGVLCYGGLSIYGTHIENRNTAATGNIGIQYCGTNGGLISPSACLTFGIGLKIGDGSALAATGWVVAGNISSNNTGAGGHDILVTDGGARSGTILSLGATTVPNIRNDRLLVDGVATEVGFFNKGAALDWVTILAQDGNATNPSHSFRNAPGAGLYNVGGSMFAAVGGVGLLALQAGLFQTRVPMCPPQDTGAFQSSCGIYAGAGAPSNANGANGSFYFRSDAPGTANQHIYVKAAGAWVAIA
jgi:hypothetical protein